MEFSKNLQDYPDILRPDEAAAVLQIGRNSLYKLLAEGRLKSIRIGKVYRIPKSSIIEFINAFDL